MANDFAHLVIRASAGSGKTYKLSERYLRLALAGVPIGSILATTFTRKAAGEIQNRILERLGKGALSEENAAALSRELFGDPSRLTRGELLDLAVRVARSLDEIRVCTLDSFFIQIAGGFEFEIGLPPGWRVVEEAENESLLRRALQETFAQTDARTAHELAKTLFRGKSTRSVESQILKVVKDGLGTFRESKPSAWTRLEEAIPPDSPTLDECLEAIQNAPLPINRGGSKKSKKDDGAPNYNQSFVKARDHIVQDLESKNIARVVSRGPVAALLAGKTTFSSVELDGQLKSALEIVAAYARAETILKMAKSLKELQRTLSATNRNYERLKRVERAYRFDDIAQTLANLETNDQLRRVVYRLGSKTTCLLLDEFQDSSSTQWSIIRPFARAITGKTSDDLDPNAEDFGERLTSFFCVGDVKQAIYGWRGGDAGIFDKLESSLPNLTKAPMDINWRSCATIIDVVNRIFEKLETNPIWTNEAKEDNFDETYAIVKAVKTWQKNFQRHSIAEKNADKLGYWSLEAAPLPDFEKEPEACAQFSSNYDDRFARVNRFRGETEPSEPPVFDSAKIAKDFFDDDPADLDENDDSEYGEGSQLTVQQRLANARFEYAVKRIAELSRRFPDYSIGVLLRSNKPIVKIVRGLAALGIEASAEGGALLVESPAVIAALATIKLAAHPGDLVSAYRIATVEPLAARFKINQKNYASSALNVSHEIRELIETNGLGKFVAETRNLLDPVCDDRDRERMRRFVEYAFSYEATTPRPRLDSFVAAAETTKRETPTNSKIRVMTIHASKGLEFDVVVLPELNSHKSLVQIDYNKFYSGREDSANDSDSEKDDYIVKYIPKDDRKVFPDEYLKILNDAQTKALEEALSLLYVAITRPVRALVAIVDGTPVKKEDSESKSKSDDDSSGAPKLSKKLDFAGILRWALAPNVQTLSATSPYYKNAQVLFEYGDPDWDRSDVKESPAPAPRESAPDAAKESAPVYTRTDARRELLKRETPTQRRGTPTWTAPQTFSRGSALHACFELVEWLDQDGAPSDDELLRVVAPIVREKRDAMRIVDEFKTLLKTPYVENLLSISTLDPRKRRPTSLFRDPLPSAVELDDAALEKLADPKWVVFRERPFSFLDGDVILRGIIDRLTLLMDGDRVVAADVLDYKSNVVPNESANDLVANLTDGMRKEYRRQLEAYEKVVRAWYDLPKEKVSTRLAFLSYGTTIDPRIL